MLLLCASYLPIELYYALVTLTAPVFSYCVAIFGLPVTPRHARAPPSPPDVPNKLYNCILALSHTCSLASIFFSLLMSPGTQWLHSINELETEPKVGISERLTAVERVIRLAVNNRSARYLVDHSKSQRFVSRS